MKHQHTYDLKIYNGRVKVYVDGFVMFTFNQIDFAGITPTRTILTFMDWTST